MQLATGTGTKWGKKENILLGREQFDDEEIEVKEVKQNSFENYENPFVCGLCWV